MSETPESFDEHGVAEQGLAAANHAPLENGEDSLTPEKSMDERQMFQGLFSEVRVALQEANDRMRRIEESVSTAMARKVSLQFLELFNLIADTKESTLALARQNMDVDLEKAAHNMGVFLDMIAEDLLSHGVRSVVSQPGGSFLVKYHEQVNGDPQFDPRNAVVKASIRMGFLWGDRVLQKERVEI